MKLRSFYKSSPQVGSPSDTDGPSTSEQAITEQPDSNLSSDISISESNISIERMTPDSKIFGDGTISDPNLSEQITPPSDLSSDESISELNLSSELITPRSDMATRGTFSELNVSREDVTPQSDVSAEGTTSEVNQSTESVSTEPHGIGRRCLKFLSGMFKLDSPAVIAWIFTWVNLTLLMFAIYFDPWRLFSVDRASLQRMAYEGRIDISLLQENISMTRTQGIFQECILHHPSSTVLIGNETNYFSKSICYNLLPTSIIRPKPVNRNFQIITSDIETQQGLGCVMTFLSVLLLIAGSISEIRIRWTVFFNFMIIVGGVFNTLLHLLFFVISSSLDTWFNRDDPSFPVPWPKSIREATLIDTWQAGPIRWLVAMGCQVLVIVFNVQRIRQPEVLTPN